MTQEKFTHGRYEVERSSGVGGHGFNVTDSRRTPDAPAFIVEFHEDGVDLMPFDSAQSIYFANPSEFDELRDLITALRERVTKSTEAVK